VDPGASGAVALLGPGFADGRVVDTKEPREIEAAVESLMDSARAACGYEITQRDGDGLAYATRGVYIEDVHSMPGEGHVGVFSFGQAKGVPRGWFAARGWSVALVAPQAWQRRFFGDRLVGVDKARRKDVILAAARKRWPEASLGRAKDEATAAALFIAQAGVETKPW
jgi:hypothetical protein